MVTYHLHIAVSITGWTWHDLRFWWPQEHLYDHLEPQLDHRYSMRLCLYEHNCEEYGFLDSDDESTSCQRRGTAWNMYALRNTNSLLQLSRREWLTRTCTKSWFSANFWTNLSRGRASTGSKTMFVRTAGCDYHCRRFWVTWDGSEPIKGWRS